MMNVLSPPHVRKRDFLEHVLTWPVRGSLTRETASGIVYRRESVQFLEIRNVADENIRGTGYTRPANDWEPMRFELGLGRNDVQRNRQSNESGVGNGFFATILVCAKYSRWNGRSS